MTDILDRYIGAASARFGVPASMVRSVIATESGGRWNATSGKGAGGYMQLMPNTYAELAGKHGFGQDRFDPEDNINAGAAYLGQLYRQFGNWDDALAAYNAGPNRWMRVKAGTATAPAETTAYVPRVKAGIGPDMEAPTMATGTFGDVLKRVTAPGWTGGPTTEEDMLELSRTGQMPPPAQHPLPRPAMPAGLLGGTDRTDALLDRMAGLLGDGRALGSGYRPSELGPRPDRYPAPDPWRHSVQGALQAVLPLMGEQREKVSPWQVLAAAGAGLQAGQQGYRREQQEHIGQQLQDIGARLKVEGLRTDQDRLAGQRQAAFALARKLRDQGRPDEAAAIEQNPALAEDYFKALLKPADNEPKVVPRGGAVYRNGKWETAPGGSDDPAGGPFEGTSIDGQMYNILSRVDAKEAAGEPLTATDRYYRDLARRHFGKERLVPGPDGVVRAVPPEPLPQFGDRPSGARSEAPPAAAPSPAGDAAAPTPAQTPGRPPVREVVPAKPKEIPATTTNNLLEFTTALRKAEDALAAVETAPEATGPGIGLANKALPGDALNWFQPSGAAARAAIADIGSLKIHDRSGAAVTAAEFPRLKPFVPEPGDTPATVKMKLERFKEELIAELRDQASVYGPEQGYRPNPILEEVMKTGRAPRYAAPISGGDAPAGGPTVLRFDAQGNPIK